MSVGWRMRVSHLTEVRYAEPVSASFDEAGMTALALPSGLDGYVFKAKSPSCGIHGIPRYGPGGQPVDGHGRGLYAGRVLAALPLLATEDEGRLNDPVLREAFAERLFAPLPRRYDRLAAALSFGQDRRWRSEMVARAVAASPRTVLDVATGPAGVAVQLTQRSAARVVGADLTAPMLEQAKVVVARRRLGDRISLVRARGEELPFADGTFDAVTSAYLLRYVGEPAAVVAELARVLRPRAAGGVLGTASHEQVVFCYDPPTGLRAIIAIYSTTLGPALGGTRFYPYPDENAAITDALNLSRAMAYKNALAGLDLGGGKAVIIGDPATIKTEALLRAYGRFVQSLGGRYITACDIGTYSADMDIVARECQFVTGRTEPHGGAGDSSVLTAFGVFQGMRAAAEHVWGTTSLSGRSVAIEGVGKVGSHLVGHLVEDGATVLVYDIDPAAVQRVRDSHPEVAVVATRDELVSSDIDVYAPCAMGGAIDDNVAGNLRAAIICGGANNQLAHADMDKQLSDRGIVYVPDYLVNAGGVIQVADELDGFRFERARSRAAQIFDTAKKILAIADAEGVPPAVAADRLAERRMSEVGRLRSIWLGN